MLAVGKLTIKAFAPVGKPAGAKELGFLSCAQVARDTLKGVARFGTVNRGVGRPAVHIRLAANFTENNKGDSRIYRVE